MLRFEKLFLQGFKSFCDPTEVLFDDVGITAVVGPNGCGKSNVADAISWVIGEQRAKALRGGKMDDVIFQGSRTRTPAGMAEVILTMVVQEDFEIRSDAQPEAEVLKHAEESLSQAQVAVEAVNEAMVEDEAETTAEAPVGDQAGDQAVEPSGDRQESTPSAAAKPARKRRKAQSKDAARVFQAGERVTVGRRLYRTGESEYEMNGRICRLRDIQDLFAGTGLGAAHYAIIEQGRIGQVLSAKPLDRRALIEEAAGISKFKMRQHAAELKLEASKTNLARITDIIAEIERQQNSLKRQASRARRYKRLRQEMRDLMRSVYVVDYRVTSRSLAELDAGLAEASGRELELAASIAEREAAQTEASRAARGAEEDMNETRQIASNLDLELERARQQQTYLSEQIQSLTARSAQFARDQAAIVERSHFISQETGRLRMELQSLEQQINTESKVLAEEEERHRRQMQSDAEAEQRMEAARQSVLECATHLERWRQLTRQFTDSVDRGRARLDGLATERARAETQSQAAKDRNARVAEEIDSTAVRQQQTANSLAEIAGRLADLRRQREARQSELSALQHELTVAEQRLKSLAQIEERRTYFSEAVQALMKQSSERRGPSGGFSALGTLADFVRVSPEHESMIETALRDELQYVVVPTFDDALGAIEFLKSEGAGRATFLVLEQFEKDRSQYSGNGDKSLRRSEVEAAKPQVRDGSGDGAIEPREPAGSPDLVDMVDQASNYYDDSEFTSGERGEYSFPGSSDYKNADPGREFSIPEPKTEASGPKSADLYLRENKEDSLGQYQSFRYQTLDTLLGLTPDLEEAFKLAMPGLAKAKVVDDAAQALLASQSSNGSGPVVTLARTGERAIAGRLVTGGSASETGIGVLALKREIGELQDKIDSQAARVRSGEEELEEVKAQIDQSEDSQKLLDGEQRQVEKRLVVLREQLQQCERDLERTSTYIRVIQQETAQAEEELREFEAKLQHASEQTGAAENSHREAEAVVAAAQTELAELRRNAEIRVQELSQRRAEFAARTERRRGLQNDIRRLETEASDLESRLNRNRLEAIEAEDKSVTMQATLTGTSEQLKELTARREECRAELERKSAEVAAAREKVDALDVEVRAARETASQAREERAQRQVEKAKRTSDLEHLINSCHAELGENIVEVCERLELAKRAAESASLPGTSSIVSGGEAAGPDQLLQVGAADLSQTTEPNEVSVEGGQPVQIQPTSESSPASSTQSSITVTGEPLSDVGKQINDDDEEGDGEIEITFWTVPEDFDLEVAKARLDELRAKMEALGPVNMMALDELVEVEERFTFLASQKADIEKAIADTQAAIAEIKRRSRERFVEAFHAINENFKLMFIELFGGGHGEMRLIDETDVLESGIEIIAQPPGKRLQNVLLLSGGEKAMAALSLVMAIFKYRPSPFCLLDEVDAPLDDVNIGRFSDKIIEMSRGTQFMVITHSKRTMEAARTLYGVTMEDPGVSKLVSVRLS